MKVPCKNCEDRELGCHSECEKYLEFQEQRRSVNKKRQHDAVMHDVKFNAVCRMRRLRPSNGMYTNVKR